MRMRLAALGAAVMLLACGGDEGSGAEALNDTSADDVGAEVEVAPEVTPETEVTHETEVPETEVVETEVAETEVEPDTVQDAAEPEIEDTVSDAEPEIDSGPTTWRSALYPEDWSPGFADPSGARLQDYSYAGYHHGEIALGAGIEGGVAALARFDVGDYGADATGEEDSTAAIQAAIDAAEVAGGQVYFGAGLYRVDDRLSVGASRVVLAGEGPDTSRLWFTRRAGMNFAAHLTFVGRETATAESPLVADGAVFDTAVEVADASGFAPGDDVLVGQTVSDAFVAEHGMSGTWQAFNGTWQAFFRRSVVAVDGARVTIDVPLRYPLKTAYGASLRRVEGTLHEVALTGLGVANAVDWEGAWQGNQVNAVVFEHVADAWVEGVASFPSPGAPESGMGAGAHLQSNGLMVTGSKRVTIANSHMAAAQNRGTGGNGYLFEVRQSSEVLTRACSARLGRHNFIQNWGFGASGCVWLRVFAEEGGQVPFGPVLDTSLPAPSEYHHSLATANLVDASRFDDGFHAINRGSESSGAGHSSTECVFWNYAGDELVSLQYGLGYVIGSAPGTPISTSLDLFSAGGTAPEDWVEGLGQAETLVPASLYEDQLERRLSGPR